MVLINVFKAPWSEIEHRTTGPEVAGSNPVIGYPYLPPRCENTG